MKGDQNLNVVLEDLFDVAIWDREEDKVIFSCICSASDLLFLVNQISSNQGIQLIPHVYEKEN